MPLSVSDKLGHYEVLSLPGAGGNDAKLRHVKIVHKF
jgi:hypothetical protein